jgi:pectate lyase
MRVRFVHRALFVLLLICQFSICLGTESTDANESSKYLDAVRIFADNVLKYGRDTYGPKHTPLFVDGLNIHTHVPVKWIAPNGDRWILCNLASQQNLFRILDGLTRITGDPKYKLAAMDAIEYAFENLRSPNGLLYWGGHAAYDVGAENPCGSSAHENKNFYPHYELMWEVNPKATRQFIESFWSGHIRDWSNLDMDRHCYQMNQTLEEAWKHEYKGGPVFFKPKQGIPASFITTAGPLVQGATVLTKLSGDGESLVWAKRLAHRYVETRDPRTGIGAGIFTGEKTRLPTLRELKNIDLNELSRDSFFPALPTSGNSDVRERISGYFEVSPGIPFNGLVAPWICALLTGEMMGSEGKEFIQWSVEELTAWGKVAYRKSDNSWIPMLRDSTPLEDMVIKKDGSLGPKGTTVVPMSVARNIALGNGFGDIAVSSVKLPELERRIDCADPYTLLGFLELYRKTQSKPFLERAKQVGDNILASRFHKGFFAPSDRHFYTRFDSPEPLALLHLHAVSMSRNLDLPVTWPSKAFFEHAYRDKDSRDDNSLVYRLTESPEPPISLQEAAAKGNLDQIRSLIEEGIKVDFREDGFHKTALHRAAMSGHRDVVEYLLAKGAQVDAWSGFPGGTPLDYAAENGHRAVVELLLTRGADVHSKREGWPTGDTPLHSAVRAGHKDIVELLIAYKADVNAKNNEGQTPLDIALQRKGKNIVELLIQKGADISIHMAARYGLLEKLKDLIAKGTDVNARDKDGKTALDVAVEKYNKEIATLLVDKGAEVSIHATAFIGDINKVEAFVEGGGSVDKPDATGQTLLHYATAGNNRAIAELLISHDADVNAVAGTWRTPLGVAAQTGSVDVAEYLIAHGANVDGREGQWTPLQEAAYYSKEMVELLLAHGANINEGGWPPLHSALDAERFDILELLLTKGADVSIKDDKGRTPLHIAAWYAAHDNPKMVELLLSKGADINAKDSSGKTALGYAVEGGYTEIAEILRKHGAKE